MSRTNTSWPLGSHSILGSLGLALGLSAIAACATSPTPTAEPSAAAPAGSGSSASPVAAAPSSSHDHEAGAATPSSSATVGGGARIEADLLSIANIYPNMSRADGSWWSPLDCRAPTHPSFASKAGSGGHGRKIYTLFVKDIVSYAALTGVKVAVQPAPQVPQVEAMTQVVVKEAWTSHQSASWEASCTKTPAVGPSSPSFLAPVMMDGKAYRACASAGLFIMYRPAASAGIDAQMTHDGWVYGTVSYEPRMDPALGQTTWAARVTASGRIASCMGCHDKAPHGRLFGMAKSP